MNDIFIFYIIYVYILYIYVFFGGRVGVGGYYWTSTPRKGGQIIRKFVGLRAKTYSYLKGNNDEDKKGIGTKKSVVKRNLKFRDYKKYLKTSQLENKINCLEKKEIDTNSLKGITHYKKVILKTQ